MMRKSVYILTAIMLISLFSGCSTVLNEQSVAPLQEGYLRAHFIDVGQGDSALVELPNGEVMLIDGGNRSDGDLVVRYLRRAGVKNIDYVVATHPHEDHIGGLIDAVENFTIGKFYMPKVVHNSKTFSQLINAVVGKGHKIYRAKSGGVITHDDMLRVEFLAPNRDSYDELNNYSAVVKVDYRGVGIIFMGDAEMESEKEIDPSRTKAQVIKIGHHGSGSSTSPGFLETVQPDYAVISVGKGNDYGHPHAGTLELLESRGVKILRTDESGTIVITTDGNTINTESMR